MIRGKGGVLAGERPGRWGDGECCHHRLGRRRGRTPLRHAGATASDAGRVERPSHHAQPRCIECSAAAYGALPYMYAVISRNSPRGRVAGSR
jgi:hypothetical protein